MRREKICLLQYKSFWFVLICGFLLYLNKMLRYLFMVPRSLLNRENTYVFAGFNFPLLLQLVCLDENAEEAEIRRLADTGKAAVIFMNDYQIAEFKDEDE